MLERLQQTMSEKFGALDQRILSLEQEKNAHPSVRNKPDRPSLPHPHQQYKPKQGGSCPTPHLPLLLFIRRATLGLGSYAPLKHTEPWPRTPCLPTLQPGRSPPCPILQTLTPPNAVRLHLPGPGSPVADHARLHTRGGLGEGREGTAHPVYYPKL